MIVSSVSSLQQKLNAFFLVDFLFSVQGPLERSLNECPRFSLNFHPPRPFFAITKSISNVEMLTSKWCFIDLLASFPSFETHLVPRSNLKRIMRWMSILSRVSVYCDILCYRPLPLGYLMGCLCCVFWISKEKMEGQYHVICSCETILDLGTIDRHLKWKWAYTWR